MPPTFGSALGTKAASGVTTTNFIPTASVVPGGLIVFGCGFYKNGTVTGVTFSGTGLTCQTDKFVTPYASDLNYAVAIGSCYAPSGYGTSNPLTLTLNGGGNAFAITFGAAYWTGAAASSWLDVANNGAGVNGSQHWVSSLTNTDPNGLVVGYGWIDLSTGTDTPDVGWSEALDFQNTTDTNTAAMVYKTVASAGSYSPGGTFTGGGPYITVAASYNAAAIVDNTTKPALPGMFTPQLRQDGWF